jgi:hypothetical protein
MTKHYIIYKTTNLINGKFYIGKHTTNNKNDSYLGSGLALTNAIKKYGKENFKKEILFECDSEEELSLKEFEIVTEQLCKDPQCYNICRGGYGGFHNKQNPNDEFSKSILEHYKEWYSKQSKEFLHERGLKCFKTIVSRHGKEEFSKKIKDGLKKYSETHPQYYNTFLGKKHTEQTKLKISSTMKAKTYNAMWIKNDSLKFNRIIKKTDDIPFGWSKGRNMTYKMDH